LWRFCDIGALAEAREINYGKTTLAELTQSLLLFAVDAARLQPSNRSA
jgi:hypothetical protein